MDFAKGNCEERQRKECLEGEFQFGWGVSDSKREKRESRVEEASMEFDMHVCKRRRSVQKFPPKCPT